MSMLLNTRISWETSDPLKKRKKVEYNVDVESEQQLRESVGLLDKRRQESSVRHFISS